MGRPGDERCLDPSQAGMRTSHERIFAEDPGAVRPSKKSGRGRSSWDECCMARTRV